MVRYPRRKATGISPPPLPPFENSSHHPGSRTSPPKGKEAGNPWTQHSRAMHLQNRIRLSRHDCQHTGNGVQTAKPGSSQETISEESKITLDFGKDMCYTIHVTQTRRTVPGTGCRQRDGTPGSGCNSYSKQFRKNRKKFLTKPQSCAKIEKSHKRARTGHRVPTESLASLAFPTKPTLSEKSKSIVGCPSIHHQEHANPLQLCCNRRRFQLCWSSPWNVCRNHAKGTCKPICSQSGNHCQNGTGNGRVCICA